MNDASLKYKGVKIQLQPRELPKGGWTVDVVLHRHYDEVGTKYKVKTIHSTRMEAEVSGLAVAHGIIDQGQ
jgi:hypothetical protein